MNRIFKATLMSCGLIASATPAISIEVQNLFGHEVRLSGDSPDRSLLIDGRELHKNAIIAFDIVLLVNGIPTLIGGSSAGGNACDTAPFVISFPPGGKPRFDGPIDSCAYIVHEVVGSKLIFSTKNVPGQGREQWSWTPEDGIKGLGVTKFEPTDTAGWQILRERSLEHPSDALKNVEIAKSIKDVVGDRYDDFEQIITGTGGGDFKGDDYVGTTCTRHMCGDEEALLFLSGQEKRAYLAWRPSEKKIVVYPPVGEWPEKAKLELRSWAEKWK